MARIMRFMARSFRNKGLIHVISIDAFAMPIIGFWYVTTESIRSCVYRLKTDQELFDVTMMALCIYMSTVILVSWRTRFF
jgi:hypothetical protein